jgi:DNA polymerase-3 subunit delta
LIYLMLDDLAGRARLLQLQTAMGDPTTASLNTTVFDASRLELGDLRAACEAMPFLAERRLVVARGQLARSAARESGGSSNRNRAGSGSEDALAAYLALVPITTDLVFLESELPATGPVLKAIQELVRVRAAEIVHDAPMDGGAAVAWVRRRVEERGGRIGVEAAMALVGAAGHDARALEREIEKLLLLADGRAIAPEDVRALVPAADDARVFDLVDAIGNRDAREAVRTWRTQLRAGEDPHRLLSMVSRQVRLLIVAREHLASGHPPVALASAVGLPPGVASKLAAQARRWSPASLTRIMARLVAMDRESKTGGPELGPALEALIAELVAGRASSAA